MKQSEMSTLLTRAGMGRGDARPGTWEACMKYLTGIRFLCSVKAYLSCIKPHSDYTYKVEQR